VGDGVGEGVGEGVGVGDGVGEGLGVGVRPGSITAIPQGVFKPEIKAAFTVAPDIVYSPTVLFELVTKIFVPKTAIPIIKLGSEMSDAFITAPEVE
jgi:hypothetical protein